MKKENTGELHLFEGEFTQESCTVENKSICGQMLNSDNDGASFKCLDEDKARIQCASIGKSVCGN